MAYAFTFETSCEEFQNCTCKYIIGEYICKIELL
jgi:hypothetical protein